MIRPLTCSLTVGIALLTATISDAHEIFPVVHNEPITVRVLSGKSGQPLPHLHLVLIGGYDHNDLHDQLFRDEALTDAQGVAWLSNQFANLPWIQVWVTKKPLCQANPRKVGFSVELIRRDGLSAPNRCGIATVENAPGILTIFVKNKTMKVSAELSTASAPAHTPVPAAAPMVLPASTAPIERPAQAVVSASAPQPAKPAVVAALPAAPVPAPIETMLKTALPVQAATPAPAVVPAVVLQAAPAKATARIPVRRVAGKPAARRVALGSHHAALASHKAKPVLASCAVDQPAAKPAAAAKAAPTVKPAPAAAPVPPAHAPKTDAARMARARARALGISLNSKPAAGVTLSAAKFTNPGAPPKPE